MKNLKQFGKFLLIVVGVITIFNNPWVPLSNTQAVGFDMANVAMITLGIWAFYDLFLKKTSHK